MVCQVCGERPATVHILKTINNQKDEHHLCEVCAREQGQVSMEPTFGFPNFSVQNILSSLIDAEPWVERDPGAVPDTLCPGCGLTFRQFRERGLFGCGQCYEAFSGELAPLLRRIQGFEKHRGKMARHVEGHIRMKKDLAELRRELQAAITKEQYEHAAKIHERIKAIEKHIAAGGAASDVE